MHRFIEFVARAVLLMFDYPIAVVTQIMCFGPVLLGIAMFLGTGEVSSLIVYQAIAELHPAAPAWIGGAATVIALVTFVSFFFIWERVLFYGTYLVIGFWAFIMAIYIIEGASVVAFVYAGIPLSVLIYAICYITIHRRAKPSPWKVLTGKVPAATLDE